MLSVKRRLLDSEKDESLDSTMSSITVAVRLRPFNERELNDLENVQSVKIDSINAFVTVQDRNDVNSNVQFAFDHCFDSTNPKGQDYCDQEQLYTQLCQPKLQKALDGSNVCIFAYGQTGTGKSYTIMGTDKDNGIIPRFAKELFLRVKEQKKECAIEASFYEIYNEKIYDLLSERASGEKQTLRIRVHPQTGPYVEHLTTKRIESIDQLFSLLVKGNKQRATAATSMNDRSSRSHAIFSIHLISVENNLKNETNESLISKINFVDLAGSERASFLQSTGERLKEGNMINKSLLTLGKVITLLSEGDPQAFIPYRDSLLTFLLRECLGGNSSTCMIATISPSQMNLEETMSTLRYASKARKIVNKVKINTPYNSTEDLVLQENVRILRELNHQIETDLNDLRVFNQSQHDCSMFIQKVSQLFSSVLNA